MTKEFLYTWSLLNLLMFTIYNLKTEGGKDSVEYKLEGENPSGYLYLVDNAGKNIRSIHLNRNIDYLTLSTESLKAGLYYCKLVVDNVNVQTIKLIISK